MANIKSFPNNQDEYIGAETVMLWHHGRSSGVFGADNNAAVAPVLDAMAVTVSDGIGWLSNANGNGVVWWVDDEAQTGAKHRLSVDMADAVLPRIDRVIVSWQTTNYVALPEVKVLKGTPASAPKAPALTNDSMVQQISLASIRIPAGVTAIDASMITDERLDASVCGIVTDAVGIDTSVMHAQFTEFYGKSLAEQEAYIAQQQAAWNAYFEGIQNDTLVPVPRFEDAKKAMLVNEEGNGYTLEEIQTNIPVTSTPEEKVEIWIDPEDTTEVITLDKLGGAPMTYAKKVGAPYNLLDNSDFRNPVNQRGYASGTTLNSWTYFLDRWRTINNGGSVTLNANGLTTNTPIQQPLNRLEYLIGKKVTIAAGTSNGAVICKSFTLNKASGWSRLADVSGNGVTIEFDTLSETVWAFNIGGGSNIAWVALYEGEYTAETLPEYQPKGYAAELAECQRYVLPWFAYDRLANTLNNSSTLDFILPTPQTMRALPSITNTRGGSIELFVNELNGNVQSGFTIAVKSWCPSFVSFRATKTSHGLSNGALLEVHEKAILSADL